MRQQTITGPLHAMTARVDGRAPANPALTIDCDKAGFHLARLKATPEQAAADRLKDVLESRMLGVELTDALIEVDNETDILHHFLQSGSRRAPPAVQRRIAPAALVAVGYNSGPTRMAAASGLSAWEIRPADWCLSGDALKTASVDLVNVATHLPMRHIYRLGDTCSADAMRFYVPVDILAADFSHLLRRRGVTLHADTGEKAICLRQEPIPCRLREATLVLDGLMEYETKLDPPTVYTDTHGYTVTWTPASRRTAPGGHQARLSGRPERCRCGSTASARTMVRSWLH